MQIYTPILLKSIKERDNASLIGDYEITSKKTTIYYICNCGEENHKLFSAVKNTGLLCKKCMQLNRTIKVKNTKFKNTGREVLCTINKLNEVMERDNAILLVHYDNISGKTNIHFKCNCGEDFIKNCVQLIKVSGAFCKKCTRITWTKHIKETNIKKYGTECSLNSPEIKNKIIDNNLKNYGVEHIMQSTQFRNKVKDIILKKYGVSNVNKLKEVRDKIIKTNLLRYNATNPMKNEEVKKRLIQRIQYKYNVNHISQSSIFKEKLKKTCLKRYGVESTLYLPEIKIKIVESFITKYGVSNPNKLKEIRDKIKITNIKRYGVEYPSQSKEINEKTQKNAKHYKKYTMPSGKICNIQGYENYALNELITQYTEDEIKTDRIDIPRITYIVNNKKKYYFPDIYIPKDNKIIEVKSTWTYNSKIDNIQLKLDATKAAGYTYEIWIYKNNKGDLFKKIL
jgi:hypothetical protein